MLGGVGMSVARFAVMLLVAIVCAEASLQQPPSDGRPLPPSPTKLTAQAGELYRAQRWVQAAEKYEAGLAAEPGWFAGHFYLANCYDHLYTPSQAGQADNDTFLQKALQHYQIAAERDPDTKIRKLAMAYMVAAYGPDKLNDPRSAEPIVRRMIEMDPADPVNYASLAKLYEDAGRYDDAEEVLAKAVSVAPQNPVTRRQLAFFYSRVGDFAKTMDAVHAVVDLDPTNPESHQLLATFYWEKVQRDRALSQAQKIEYIQKGIDADDRALAIKADYIDALMYKNILLRMKANETADPVERDALIAEADSLRVRAMELNRLRGAQRGGSPVSTPPGARGGRERPVARDR